MFGLHYKLGDFRRHAQGGDHTEHKAKVVCAHRNME